MLLNQKDSIRLVVALAMVFAAAAVAASAFNAWSRHDVPVVNAPQTVAKEHYPAAENLVIDSPLVGDKLTSPLVVTGKARRWYFEGSFPIELRDADNHIIARVVATAQSDWMSEDFVPFKASLVFSNPATPTGTLTLKKDNPSGLPEKDEQVSVPVNFAPSVSSKPSMDGCRPTGCSGEVCSDTNVITTCEYTAAYACYKQATCARQADGQCGWTMNPNLSSCLQNAKGASVDMPQ